jgi:TRAP-type C4-dicarboxylate transport system substrate-binding protein
MKKCAVFFAFVFCFFFTTNGAFAQQQVRLASPLPRSSEWGRALDRLAADWARVTNNQVRLRVLHDGIEGGETDMLSSLSSNNIQAALFASPGISEICPAVMTLSVPFNIKNDTELDLVLKDVLPSLETQINKTNYVLITWAKGGWVNIFSKEPVVVPDDLRRLKIATNPELKSMNQVFRTMRFQLVESSMTDVGTKLASNAINSLYLVPAMIAPMQLHRYLNHMLGLPIAPVMGAIVMNRVTWNKIKPEHQREIIRVTREMAAQFDESVSKTNDNAVVSMSKGGLKVNRPNQAQEEMWRAELHKAMPQLMGTLFDTSLYQQIDKILEKSRNQ